MHAYNIATNYKYNICSVRFLDGKISTCYLGIAPITEGMATVTINNLQCGVTYNITAEGMLNETLGSRSSHGNIAPRPCPMTSSECNTIMCVHTLIFMRIIQLCVV